jgi:hypothetical protein
MSHDAGESQDARYPRNQMVDALRIVLADLVEAAAEFKSPCRASRMSWGAKSPGLCLPTHLIRLLYGGALLFHNRHAFTLFSVDCIYPSAKFAA